MKTPEEILRLVASENLGKQTHELIPMAMKEYAKMWVKETSGYVVVALENNEPPANAIFRIFNKIDAQ